MSRWMCLLKRPELRLRALFLWAPGETEKTGFRRVGGSIQPLIPVPKSRREMTALATQWAIFLILILSPGD